jgi:hypothetical protein
MFITYTLCDFSSLFSQHTDIHSIYILDILVDTKREAFLFHLSMFLNSFDSSLNLFLYILSFFYSYFLEFSQYTSATLTPLSDVLLIEFLSFSSSSLPIFFKSLQEQLFVYLNETSLVFFRLYNPNDNSIVGITTFTIYPYIAAPFLTKIQCFCFEQLIIKSHETLDLPVLFYIDSNIQTVLSTFKLTLLYNFFEITNASIFFINTSFLKMYFKKK